MLYAPSVEGQLHNDFNKQLVVIERVEPERGIPDFSASAFLTDDKSNASTPKRLADWRQNEKTTIHT